MGTGRLGKRTNGLRAACLLGLMVLMALPEPAQSQLGSRNQTLRQTVPRVFLDCQLGRACPDDHFRTEITFVNWVRDRTDADLHVILTATRVGGGGQRYALDFIGLKDFSGRNDELTYISHGSDARQAVIDGVTHTLNLGLLRYLVESGQGRNFQLQYVGPPVNGSGAVPGGMTEAEQGFYDRWDYWTFRFGLSGNMNIRETRSERRLNPQIQADRVTEQWKINLSLWSNFRRQTIQLSDGREIRNDTDTWRATALVVRSISDHVSIGIDGSGSNSLQNNYRSRLAAMPAFEWNYFPYMQATRRQLIAHYAVGVEVSDYYEETIFGETEETLPQHRFAVVYNAREQWGNAGVGIEASQYLHDGSLYSYGLNGDLSLRVVRGLELNVSGSASRVANQIHVPAGNISDQDILLGRQALPTGYEYEASVGFNYRWGSSFANVVNSRFPRSVR